MSDLVSAVIKPKGRIINQFLEYFAVQLFPEKEELLRETVQVLERDKHRLKEQARRGENPLSQREVMELLFEGYSKKFPDLRYILRVIPDYKRESQPYRVGLGSIDGVVDGQRFRLIGEVNPIETLRDNNVNFAIASSDLLLAKFVSSLPNDIDMEDPAQILANLPPDTTTIQYDGPLKINGSRHMLFMNFRPEKIEVGERGLPKLEEGTVIYVNGEYYLVYKKLFNGRYRLNESEKVEPAVLIVDGRKNMELGLYLQVRHF